MTQARRISIVCVWFSFPFFFSFFRGCFFFFLPFFALGRTKHSRPQSPLTLLAGGALARGKGGAGDT